MTYCLLQKVYLLVLYSIIFVLIKDTFIYLREILKYQIVVNELYLQLVVQSETFKLSATNS